MSRGRSRSLLVLVSMALLGATTACTGTEEKAEAGRPVSPAPVELSPEGLPEGVSVGVVVSLSSAPGEGVQWSEAAEGARVAAYRYGLADLEVSLLARDDRGTARGAKQAVRDLADEGVAGIVLATEGDHVSGALDAASELGVPVLLPYDSEVAELPPGAWRTGPDVDQVGAALQSAMAAADVARPVLVDAGGGELPGVPTRRELSLRAGEDAARLAARLARETRAAERVDAVVVSGPAQLQAQAVQALQARDVDVPVFLGDDAVSPAFADTLARTGGSLTTPMTTSGLDTDDVAALESGSDGTAISAYLAALRMTAEDGDVTDFFDNEPFETVAPVADVRTHDAVVALVSAAASAGSADPGDVLEALSGLKVDHGDGLAGPILDFGSPSAVPDDAVVPLQATTQDPGLRPVTDAGTPRLYWFEAPTD